MFRKIVNILTKQEKRYATLLCIALFVSSCLEVVGIGLIFAFMNVILDPNLIQENQYLQMAYHQFGFSENASFIFAAGIFLTLLLVAKNLIAFGILWASAHFAVGKIHTLSTYLLKTYVYQPYQILMQKNSSELQRNILDETQYMVMNILFPMFLLFAEVATICLIAGFLFWQYPITTMVLLGVFCFTYGIYFFFVRRLLERLGHKRFKANKERFQYASEAFGGIEALTVSGHQDYFVNRYSQVAKVFASGMAWSQIMNHSPRLIMEIFGFVTIMGLILYHLAAGTEMVHVIPILVLYAAAGYRLMPAFSRVTTACTQMRFHKRAFEVLYPDLMTRPYPKEEQNFANDNPVNFKEEISFQNVHFTYPGSDHEAIQNINLIIPKNKAIAIVGKSGAGKSTVINMLLGLLEPTKGHIYIDGVEYNNETKNVWRPLIGYVPQEIFLADDTIAKNIAFGVEKENVDMELVQQAASMAQIHRFIKNELQDGYQTLVGERGARLSGGQIQRIGIARALYRQPQILIMDEATSALDNITECALADTMKTLTDSITVVTIAHHLLTIKDSDHVYMIERGEIIAEGTFDQLSQQSESFNAMLGT